MQIFSPKTPFGRNTMDDNSARPLTEIKPGQPVVIVALQGGFECQHRLISLGLFVNQEVQVLRSVNGHGPVLLAVGKTRLALGQGVAKTIMVVYVTDIQSKDRIDQSKENNLTHNRFQESISQYFKRRGGNICRGRGFRIQKKAQRRL
jgi:Fe2+ transport system protein FeoA